LITRLDLEAFIYIQQTPILAAPTLYVVQAHFFSNTLSPLGIWITFDGRIFSYTEMLDSKSL
jgi:hypothetical protein